MAQTVSLVLELDSIWPELVLGLISQATMQHHQNNRVGANILGEGRKDSWEQLFGG